MESEQGRSAANMGKDPFLNLFDLLDSILFALMISAKILLAKTNQQNGSDKQCAFFFIPHRIAGRILPRILDAIILKILSWHVHDSHKSLQINNYEIRPNRKENRTHTHKRKMERYTNRWATGFFRLRF